MPFGLMNTPATFQRLLDAILKKYTRKSFLVCLNDIFIFSKNYDQLFQDNENLQSTLYAAGVSPMLSKCH